MSPIPNSYHRKNIYLMKTLSQLSITIILGLILGFSIPHLGHFGQIVSNNIGSTGRNYFTDSIHDEVMSKETFEPQYEHLYSVDVLLDRVNNTATEGSVIVSITDTDGNVLGSDECEVIELTDMPRRFVVDTYTPLNNQYWLTVQAINTGDVAPVAVYRNSMLDRIEENIIFSYGGAIIPDASQVITYNYELPVSKVQYLVYSLFFMFVITFLFYCPAFSGSHFS